MRKTAPTICLLLLSAFAFGRSHTTSMHGQVRTYFVAADEVDWDYAPSRVDRITGEKFHFEDDPGSAGMLDPNTTMYRKAVLREYTDATFRTPKARPDAWVHLGILGPLIRAEVGDTIRVVFRNNASRPYSVHPHGVFYSKSSEGAAYLDNTSGLETHMTPYLPVPPTPVFR